MFDMIFPPSLAEQELKQFTSSISPFLKIILPWIFFRGEGVIFMMHV
jgi:hypothetical protein